MSVMFAAENVSIRSVQGINASKKTPRYGGEASEARFSLLPQFNFRTTLAIEEAVAEFGNGMLRLCDETTLTMDCPLLGFFLPPERSFPSLGRRLLVRRSFFFHASCDEASTDPASGDCGCAVGFSAKLRR